MKAPPGLGEAEPDIPGLGIDVKLNLCIHTDPDYRETTFAPTHFT